MFHLLLFLLINTVNAKYYRFTDCENIDNKDSCIDATICKWCNNSYNNGTYCNSISTCEMKDDSCSYNEDFNYELECTLVSVLFYLCLTFGYIGSMIIIYDITRKVLKQENVPDNTIKSINTIIFILTTTPLFVTFFVKPIVFYIMFVSYMISSVLILCCVSIKNKKKEKEGYETIKEPIN
jgi:hypothetical protein